MRYPACSQWIKSEFLGKILLKRENNNNHPTLQNSMSHGNCRRIEKPRLETYAHFISLWTVYALKEKLWHGLEKVRNCFKKWIINRLQTTRTPATWVIIKRWLSSKPSCGQGCCPLDQAAQGHIQPSLECLWGSMFQHLTTLWGKNLFIFYFFCIYIYIYWSKFEEQKTS